MRRLVKRIWGSDWMRRCGLPLGFAAVVVTVLVFLPGASDNPGRVSGKVGGGIIATRNTSLTTGLTDHVTTRLTTLTTRLVDHGDRVDGIDGNNECDPEHEEECNDAR